LPKVKVRLYTILREAAGTREVEVEASTVSEALTRLLERFGSHLKGKLLDEETGRLRPFYNILVNGRRISYPREAQLALKQGDILDIFPPVGGG